MGLFCHFCTFVGFNFVAFVVVLNFVAFVVVLSFGSLISSSVCECYVLHSCALALLLYNNITF